MMILNGCVIEFGRLQLRLEDDSVLNFVNSFTSMSKIDQSKNRDINYVIIDTTKSIFIRNCATKVVIIRRLKDH